MSFLDNIPFLRRSQASPAPAAAPRPAADAIPEPAPAVAAEPAQQPEAAASVAAEAAAVPVALPVAVETATPATPAPAPPTPAARAEAEVLVRAVAKELPNFLAVAVLSQADGQILAGQWTGHSGGAVEAAAADAAIVRQAQQLVQAQQADSGEQLQDVVVTLQRQLHLLQVLRQQPWLLYLAVPSQSTNLALARTVLQGFAA